MSAIISNPIPTLANLTDPDSGLNFYRIAETHILLRQPNTDSFSEEIIISGLRTAFSIQKNQSPSTNTMVLRIWNLTNSVREKLKNIGDIVTLKVGYELAGSLENIFIGDTTNVRHTYEFPDIITTFECGDGERFLNFAPLPSPLSFAAGTPIRQAIVQTARSVDLDSIYSKLLPDILIPGPQSYSGMLGPILNSFVKTLNSQIPKDFPLGGATWSIQNEVLKVSPFNQPSPYKPTEISQATGMVGVPERYTYKRSQLYRRVPIRVGWRVRSIIKSRILPWDRVLISSNPPILDENPAACIAEMVRHEGDTFGPSWLTTVEVILENSGR